MNYTVRYGETISDVILNSTGNIANWDAILTANDFSDWTPQLSAGDVLLIPDGLPVDNDTLAQLAIYPANNRSLDIPAVYGKITVIFTTLAGASPATAPVAAVVTSVAANTYFYTVRVGEGIGDCVMNSTGNIANWPLILDANDFSDWTPALIPGQILTIPPTVTPDPNTLRQLAVYPANNNSVPDVYEKIIIIFGKMNPGDWILKTGFWDDAGYWRDTAYWID